MNIKTCFKSLNAIRLRYIGTWLLDQIRQPGCFDNLVVSRRSWGAFSIFAHRRRSDGRTKASYSTRESAQKAADSLARKHKVPFAVYKCLFCKDWHVSKVGDHQAVSSKSNRDKMEVLASLKTMNRLTHARISPAKEIIGSIFTFSICFNYMFNNINISNYDHAKR